MNHSIFRVLPSGGKTTCSRNSDRVIDGDDIADIAFGGKSRAEVMSGLNNPEMVSEYKRIVDDYINEGKIVLTNLDPNLIGISDSMWIGYAPDSYIEHINIAGRSDLLNKFSEADLVQWAKDWEDSKGPKLQLEAGEFVTESIILFANS